MRRLSGNVGKINWGRHPGNRGAVALRPDFLCIGAPRCGTGWLDRNLRSHPELWLPPIKELHYLDYLPRARRLLGPVILRDRNSRRRAGRYLRRALPCLARLRPPEDLGWALRYFVSWPTDQWYQSLFPQGNRLAGECTPSYAELPEPCLARVRAINPELKIIYLLRNPIHRDWSHAAMWLRGRRRAIDNACEAEVLAALELVMRSGASNYADNLARWEQFYPSENILVGFFEDLVGDPSGLLLRIMRFLGVEATARHVPARVETPRGGARYKEVPARFAAFLATRNLANLQRIHARFDNPHTRRWLDFAAGHVEPA
jgi:hypothetical protein